MLTIRRAIALSDFLLNTEKTIEIFGMYDADNLGDEAMRTAGLSALPPGCAVPVTGSNNPLLTTAILSRRRKNLVVGGGTLIHGGGPQGQNGWLDYVEHRWKQGSRITLLGTGISFLENQIEERSDSVSRWANVLRNAAYVGVRGHLSKKTAERIGASASVFGDAAILLFDQALADQREQRTRYPCRLFGINIGEVLSGDSQVALERELGRLLMELARDFTLRIFVVNPEDITATFRVLDRAELDRSRYEIVHNYRDARLFMRKAAECEGFIGVRLHSAGLAMIAGVPSLLIAYSPKCRDFVTPIDLEQNVVDLPTTEKDVLGKIDDLLLRPERYRNVRAISDILRVQRQTISNLFP